VTYVKKSSFLNYEIRKEAKTETMVIMSVRNSTFFWNRHRTCFRQFSGFTIL